VSPFWIVSQLIQWKSHDDSDGAKVGAAVGKIVGITDGASVGSIVGDPVGASVGRVVGSAVGNDVGTCVGAGVGPGVGTAVGSALGGAVSKALETEFGELNAEDQEFETARRVVRVVGSVAQKIAQAQPDADPQTVVRNAVTEATHQHVPGLANSKIADPLPRAAAHSGRWERRGRTIVLLDL